MKRLVFLGIAGALLAGPGNHASAADAPILKAPPPIAKWDFELGTRYFLNGGQYQKNLWDPITTSQLNSRLTYSGATGHAGEIFGRINAPTGFFVKGYAGLGSQIGGKLQDEDFPPAIAPYSSTDSQMRNGELGYANIDVGHTFWRKGDGRLGAFVGYHFLHEKYNGYGCTQTAGNGGICVPSIPTTTLVLSETARWHSFRVGLVGDAKLTDRLKLTAEAAFVPYTRLDAFDNHWLRPDINPLSESGQGWGVQLEGVLSYQLTKAWSAGLGGRYWYLKTTSAHTQFPNFGPSPMEFKSERWGAFFQTSYAFGN